MPLRQSVTALLIAAGISFSVQPGAAVKVNVNFEKTFDFKQARTWAWNPNGAGQVIVGRTKDDDPEQVKQRAEPIIFDEVSKQLPGRGLKPAAAGTPDLTLTYYVLLTVGNSSQTLGQFLPSTVQWGLPPFSASTTSLEMIEQGSLVIDMNAKDRLVWRGIGEAKIKLDFDQKKRAALLREGVRDILRRFPPRS